MCRAAGEGHADVMQVLFDAGSDADIDTQDGEGFSALMRAAQGGHTEAVRLLLGGEKLDVNKLELDESGAHATVDLPNRQGYTPLAIAAGVVSTMVPLSWLQRTYCRYIVHNSAAVGNRLEQLMIAWAAVH